VGISGPTLVLRWECAPPASVATDALWLASAAPTRGGKPTLRSPALALRANGSCFTRRAWPDLLLRARSPGTASVFVLRRPNSVRSRAGVNAAFRSAVLLVSRRLRAGLYRERHPRRPRPRVGRAGTTTLQVRSDSLGRRLGSRAPDFRAPRTRRQAGLAIAIALRQPVIVAFHLIRCCRDFCPSRAQSPERRVTHAG